MDDLEDLQGTLDEITEGLESFKSTHTGELAKLREELKAERGFREELERRLNLAKVSGGREREPLVRDVPQFRDTKSGEPIPGFTSSMRLSDLPQNKLAVPSPHPVGRFLRGLILGGRADDHKQLAEERKALGIVPDSTGGYLVADALAARWIDMLRAAMVLNDAGMTTIPMPTKDLALARVTADPVVSWHGENRDLPDSDPTFGSIELHAKTAAVLIRYSLELAQDSANIESVLQSVVTNAMAHALDAAGLVGVSTDAAVAPSGVFNASGRGTVTGVGAPTSWDFVCDAYYALLAANCPEQGIGALVAHPKLWQKMSKLKTGLASDQRSLASWAPPEIARLRKLWTTAAPFTGGTTAKACLGMWSDLLFGARQQITVRVLDQAFFGSNLQYAIVAYVRGDYAVCRPSSFCTMENITVG